MLWDRNEAFYKISEHVYASMLLQSSDLQLFMHIRITWRTF